jgi:hypothetical protein
MSTEWGRLVGDQTMAMQARIGRVENAVEGGQPAAVTPTARFGQPVPVMSRRPLVHSPVATGFIDRGRDWLHQEEVPQ